MFKLELEKKSLKNCYLGMKVSILINSEMIFDLFRRKTFVAIILNIYFLQWI